MALRYRKTAERPGLNLWLLDDDMTLIDLSTYDSFIVRIGHFGSAAALTKSSNITGQVGSGAEPNGVPNCVITWTVGELSALAPGLYDFQLTATAATLDRVFSDTIEILDVIT